MTTQCGIIRGYRAHRDRGEPACDSCLAGAAFDQRQKVLGNEGKIQPGDGDPRHGVNGYSNYRCRCTICRKAWRIAHWPAGVRYNARRGCKPTPQTLARYQEITGRSLWDDIGKENP